MLTYKVTVEGHKHIVTIDKGTYYLLPNYPDKDNREEIPKNTKLGIAIRNSSQSGMLN